MTLKEFNEINWHRGNVAKLGNGKEYLVKSTKGHGKYLLLYSEEYDKCFVADYRIVESRTSDYEEPEEVYLEYKRQKREAAEAKREAERQAFLKEKLERKMRNLQEQERIHQEAVARKAAKAQLNMMKAKAKKEEEAKQKAESKPAEAPKKVVAPKPIEAPKPVVETPKPVAEAPKPVVKAEPVATSEPAQEQPKRKRQRIKISRADKVQIKF